MKYSTFQFFSWCSEYGKLLFYYFLNFSKSLFFLTFAEKCILNMSAWTFSAFLFVTAKVASITTKTCNDLHLFTDSSLSSSYILFSYIHYFMVILWWILNEPELNQVQWLVFIWLVAQMVEHWTRIAEVKGLNPVKAWIFSGILKVASKTAMIFSLFSFFTPSFYIWFF